MNTNINEEFTTQVLMVALYCVVWLMVVFSLVLYGLERWRRHKRQELFPPGHRENQTSSEEHFLAPNLNSDAVQQNNDRLLTMPAGNLVSEPAVLVSSAGSPATATFETPREQAVPDLAQSPPPPPRRILLVDDDTYVRDVLSEMLRRSGYRVDTAEDGEAGWKKLTMPASAPDSYGLLVTDNQMPNLTGVELIKRLRSKRKTLPVILASGTAPHDTESLQPGVLLRKPFTPEHLVQTVKEWLPI